MRRELKEELNRELSTTCRTILLLIANGNVHFNFYERSEFLALRRCSGEQARSPSIFTSEIGSAASLVEET